MKTTYAENRSFIEVLEAELREQIRAELLNEFGPRYTSPSTREIPSTDTVAHEHLQLWLNTKQPGRMAGNAAHRGGSAAFTAYKRAVHEGTRTQDETAQSPRPFGPSLGSSLGPSDRNDRKSAQSTETIETIASARKTRARRAHELDAMDIVAMEFFRRQGVALPENFDETELKSAYRKIALRVHPDRHVDASLEERAKWSEVFADLSVYVQRLTRHCQAMKKAA